jgi:hypothetical protein
MPPLLGVAGVARGGLDQGVTRLDFAALFGPADHGQSRTILDRARRVVALELAQNHVATGCHVGSTQSLQSHQRCFADRIFNGWINHAINVP